LLFVGDNKQATRAGISRRLILRLAGNAVFQLGTPLP
jgi:hypothetical protein